MIIYIQKSLDIAVGSDLSISNNNIEFLPIEIPSHQKKILNLCYLKFFKTTYLRK